MRTVGVAVLASALTAGCGGGQRKLGNGSWYGKLLSVDVADRKLDFAPACELQSDRWATAGSDERVTVELAAHPSLSIYFRPDGNASEGHVQSSYLRQAAGIAAHGPDPDSPPGWFVTVRGGDVTSVAEDSRLQSSDPADRRANACIWSKRTQAFVK